MNFTNRNNHYNTPTYKKKKDKEADEKEENQNLNNQKILDSIIDDDDNAFSEIITKLGNISDVNQQFIMTNYKFPRIMCDRPSYASLCAFFNATKCLDVLSMIDPAGLESEQIKKPDDYGRNPMHFACAGGNLNIIREFSRAGYSLDATDFEGCQPSHYAAMTGHQNVIKYLWTKGVDILAVSNYQSMTPLHVACLYGNLDIVKFIFETVVGDDNEKNDERHASNDDQPCPAKNSRLNNIVNYTIFHKKFCQISTPLHFACEGGHVDVLNYLLSKNNIVDIQINSLDQSSRTPLLVACQNGSFECVKALINTGKVKLDLKKRRHLPLIEAADGGHLDIVKYLLKQHDINIYRENSQHITALLAAILNDHLLVVKCLVENGALKKLDESEIGSLFISALGTDDIKLVSYLDSACTIPYHKISNNQVYHWSYSHTLKLNGNSTWGTQYMQQAILLENKEMVNFLLNKNVEFKGIDLSLNTKKAWTPFMDFLIEKGVDLSLCENEQGVPPIVSTIKNCGLKNVQIMIEKGAKLTPEIINEHDCILSVCANGNYDLFTFLMKYEPKIENGERCIEQCIFSYHRNNKKYRLKIVEELLQKGLADVNKSFNTIDNETLLTRAVSYRSIEILDLFAKYNADFENVPLKFTQLSLKPFWPVVEYLANHGCKFKNSIRYKNSIYDNDIPLLESLGLTYSPQFDIRVPLLLIDYLQCEELDKMKEKQACFVVDRFLNLNCYEGILKLYIKLNNVVYPTSFHNKKEFINHIKDCGNKDLIDFVISHNCQIRHSKKKA